jgi:glycosyltransferase involved in cell wall biosynthesis
MSRWTYRRARAVLAVSHPIRERLIEEDDVPPERVQFLSNAARLPSDLGPPALPPGVRGCPLVGVIARLQREKGLSIFLEAAGRVASTFPRARFLLVGDGPLRHELLCQARRLGLEGRVHFLGFRTDALGVLASLDLCVVPSLSEGAPLVVLEAMTLGVPVVATAVGGIPHQLRHNREGLLVPPGDATGLAEACIALLQNPERAQTLAEAGRVRARSQFRHEALVQHIEDLYCALLGEPLLVSSMKEPTPGTM